jgi:uncharacterized protein YunC (DUF1805 family)
MNKLIHERVKIDNGEVDCYSIELPGAPLIVLRAEKGFVMCGYLDISAAEKLGVVAAKVKGVATFEDVLNGVVVETTSRGSLEYLRVCMVKMLLRGCFDEVKGVVEQIQMDQLS